MIKTEENPEISCKSDFDYLTANLNNAINSDVRLKIDSLIKEFSSLKDVEKLLFCLLLPVDGVHGPNSIYGTSFGISSDEADIVSGLDVSSLGMGMFTSGGSSALHLSNQVEQSQAYTWILSHLEEDHSTCLRKDEVYEDYRAYCIKHHMKTLNTADFGKVMKRAFPNVKPRRLGQRGQSRYCYGGMRKKTEVQPPFLPDLTNEALRITSQSSPSNSSNGSQEVLRQLPPSASPFIRLLKSSSSALTTNGTADGIEDPTVRTVLGIQGVLVADVGHILLEYAHQVFGIQFKSLFQLAQHLVTNRYVNSRSKYAFALIAHAASSPAAASTYSPPPAAALADMIHKSTPKSAFDKIRTGRQNSGGVNDNVSFAKLDAAKDEKSSRSFQPSAAATPINHRQLHNSSSSIANRYHDGSAANHDLGQPTCTTPQPSGGMTSFRSPQSGLPTPDVYNTAAVAAAASSLVTHAANAFQLTNQQHHQMAQYPFNFGRHIQSSPSNQSSPYAQNGKNSNYTDSPSSTAMALAAAVAAHQKQQQYTYPSQFNISSSSYEQMMTAQSPIVDAARFSMMRPTNVATPPSAHADKSSSFSKTSGSGEYLSPLTTNSLYAASQHQNSYSRIPQQQQQQPPAPLPPGVGARSPYTPIGQPAADQSQSNYKRGVLPQPIDAPGAYEPSPRFHIGSQSPNKRARYLSNASGSSSNSTTSAVAPAPVSASTSDGHSVDPNTSLAIASPASSGGSGYSNLHRTTTNFDPHQSSSSSPYYTGRYEGMEMHSPAPPGHGVVGRTHHNLGSWGLPPIASSTNNNNIAYDTNTKRSTSDYSSMMTNHHPLHHNYTSIPDGANTPTVFRPPITPFIHDLENDVDVDDAVIDALPRLGTSPGPQIPPSSPTEFLPFYSETATKSAQGQFRSHKPSFSTTPDSDDRGNAGTLSDTSSQTPSSSIVGGQSRHELTVMASPDDDDNGNSSDDDSIHDRTLTRDLGEVNTPPMPEGLLASVPSPTDCLKTSMFARQREQLHNELSTPDSSKVARSPSSASRQNSSCPINTSNANSNANTNNNANNPGDVVSITAF